MQIQQDLTELAVKSTLAHIETPTLTVLLGSTPALCGMELERGLLTLPPADQRRVALVYIDTDVAPSTLASFRQVRRSSVHEFTLRIAVPNGISRTTPGEHDQHTFIEKRIPQNYSNGAGGMRNQGHVAACFCAKQIHDTLDQALGVIIQMSAIGSAVAREVQVNIVSFLGGGTGSGILPDICVMVRSLLVDHQLGQSRLNLICLLPEQIQGCSADDFQWRKSNAAACLLELIAFGRAAAGSGEGRYTKYMRSMSHVLTGEPLANEVYLVGDTRLGDAASVARLVGMDLLMRTTDATGVGFLEHSLWVDRRTLGAADDRGLPTMFGSSAPFEVWFPAQEAAAAYAHRAARALLALLAGYRAPGVSAPVAASGEERRTWRARWDAVACEDAGAGNQDAVNPAWFRRDDFADRSLTEIDGLWSRLEKGEVALSGRIQAIMALAREREVGRMDGTGGEVMQGGSALQGRLLRLELLRQEYTFMLEELLRHPAERVPGRPHEMETDLDRQSRMPGLVRWLRRDLASDLCEEYNHRLRLQVRGVRHRELAELLEDLLRLVGERLERTEGLIQLARSKEVASELSLLGGVAPSAWSGELEIRHQHRRHLFDLQSLHLRDGGNLAAGNLYLWATGLAVGSDGQGWEGGEDLVYARFIDGCVAFLAGSPASDGQPRSLTPEQLVRGVVNYFRGYYLSVFQQMNLFEILDKALPAAPNGVSRQAHVGRYLLEHLRHIKGMLRVPISFEASLWDAGPANLGTSIYLGVHLRNGQQQALLHDVLEEINYLACDGHTVTVAPSLDAHRLQVVLGQHAISLSTVREFYSEQNSSVEVFTRYQREWKKSGGMGLMPVHSSGEAQRLVWDEQALGFGQPLPQCLIRQVR